MTAPSTQSKSRSESASQEQRAAKAERTKGIIQESLDALAKQLESGNSAQMTAYLAAMGRFHSYSINNLFLIFAQKPDATHVAGFHTWRSMNRVVKRGEKGIAIFAPMKIRPKEPEDSEADESSPILRFRVVYVFDISQTEGDPLPEFAKVSGEPGERLKRLEHAVHADGITLESSNMLGGAMGISKGGVIVLHADLPPPERFSVLVHEWAHEKLHKVDASERPDLTMRELEAEAVAFVVNSAIGLQTSTASADYIRLYKGDKDKLAASLGRIQRTACSIIDAIIDNTHRGETAERPETCHSATNTKQR